MDTRTRLRLRIARAKAPDAAKRERAVAEFKLFLARQIARQVIRELKLGA